MRTFVFRQISALCVVLVTICAAATGSPPHWPSFRGPQARGFIEDAHVPTTWDVEKNENIKWKTPIPGLAHSSPVIWGDRVLITTAVSKEKDPYLRVGLYGESPDHPEKFTHEFKLFCLDRATGKIVWERTAHKGVPQVKRHIKSTHANSTPAIDGGHVVAFFGSEGLYCYDMDGKLLWKQDLGYLDAGAFNAKEIQWGFGSSPIIHQDRVIVACDVNNQSFLASFDLETGKRIWYTPRDEVPTWATPTIHVGKDRTQVIVNGYKHIGGFDFETGEAIWRMHGGGDIPVPTPVVAHGLVFITNGHGRLSPIYAIRLGAIGDISLAADKTSNAHIAWSRPRRGAYMPTPIVVGDYLYVGNDRGILTCYTATTGEQKYRVRISKDRSGAYSASPIAADGKLFFTTEEGEVHVVKCGPEFELLATNQMNEICMATPAVADGMLVFRMHHHVVAVADMGGKN